VVIFFIFYPFNVFNVLSFFTEISAIRAGIDAGMTSSP